MKSVALLLVLSDIRRVGTKPRRNSYRAGKWRKCVHSCRQNLQETLQGDCSFIVGEDRVHIQRPGWSGSKDSPGTGNFDKGKWRSLLVARPSGDVCEHAVYIDLGESRMCSLWLGENNEEGWRGSVFRNAVVNLW